MQTPTSLANLDLSSITSKFRNLFLQSTSITVWVFPRWALMFCPPRERRWRISRFHLFPSDMVSKSLKKVRVFFLQLMAVLVFAQLDNNAMPTEGGQRGSGSTLVQPQNRIGNQCRSIKIMMMIMVLMVVTMTTMTVEADKAKELPKNRIRNQCPDAAL